MRAQVGDDFLFMKLSVLFIVLVLLLNWLVDAIGPLIATHGLDLVMAGAALGAVSLGLLLYLWPGWGARSQP